MNFELIDRLRPIGCNALISQALTRLEGSGEPVRVIEVHRDSAVVHDGGRQSRALLLPRLARELAQEGDQLTVGDWVLAEIDPHGTLWIGARMPPVTKLTRLTSEGHQCLASNVDTALLVMGLDGDYNLRRLERYLALVQSAGVWPVIVLTKQDLAEAAGTIEDLRRRVPQNVPVHALDARSTASMTALHPYLGIGQTAVLLGSSGVGKSTLTNTLLGQAAQATAPVRISDSRGRHTTTVRSMHFLNEGACIIDTPGLRGLAVDASVEGLRAGFADIAALAGQCRFRDCTHRDEPGCAVRAQIQPDRLVNYHKLCREVRRETMTFLDRRKQRAEWKARGRAAEHRMRMKRGQE